MKRLTRTEVFTVSVHILVGMACWVTYAFALVPPEQLKKFADAYFFLVPFVLLGGLFRNLRSFAFYLTWLGISIAQLMIYFMVGNLPEFVYPRGSAFSGLRALLPALIFFQLFRLFLLQTQGREPIVSMRTGRLSGWEDEDNRNMTWAEVTFSVFIGLTIVVFNVV